MRARDIYIHDPLPLISERKFFDAFSGLGPVLLDADSFLDPDSLPDSLPHADS
jgi:2-keto-4-pentenoate hydratase/2-oxohepta-3-ene-1,7-dioic acid hydratase in catechol pathway